MAESKKKKAATQPETGISYKSAGEIPANCNDQPLVAVRNPASTQLLLVFTGMGGKVGLTLDEFYTHLPNPKPNVMFISVSASSRTTPPFVRGIPSLANDVDGTVAAFNKLIVEWGVTQVSTLGASIGTFGAIMYGIKLQARKALAFGPVTAFKPNFDDRVDLYASKRGYDFSILSSEEQDLALYYAKYNQGTEVRLFYSQGHSADRLQSENFQNTNGATLFPMMESARHSVMRSLATNGSLKTELVAVFSPSK